MPTSIFLGQEYVSCHNNLVRKGAGAMGGGGGERRKTLFGWKKGSVELELETQRPQNYTVVGGST